MMTIHSILRQSLAALLLMVAGGGTAFATSISTDELIAQSTRRLERRPADRQAVLSLSDALARKGRETGDAAYFARAVSLLDKAVGAHAVDARLWRHLSYVRSQLHDFDAALSAAQRAVDLDPGDAGAQGVLGDALLELGRYDAAEARYRRMNELVPDLASWSRLSGMASLRGQNTQAIELMRRAITAGRAAGEPAESIAWAQWQLGMEFQQVGALRSARAAYRAALLAHPGYFRAHAGLAAVAMAQRRYISAQRHFAQAMAAAPMPEYALGLAQAYRAQGRGQDAHAQLELVAHLTQLAGGRYSRETAFYHLDRNEHLERILAQAEVELMERPDLPGHQLHAWALFKNGRYSEARAAIDRALSLGTRDARLFYQAGMIHRANGDRAEARRFLRRALLLNPAFHHEHAAQARVILAKSGA